MSFLIPRLRIHSLTRSIPRASPLSLSLSLSSRPLSLARPTLSQAVPRHARLAHFAARGGRKPERHREERHREEPSSSKCLFLGKLSYDANEGDVERAFAQFGNLTRVQIPRDEGKSRGFAFVEFQHEEDAVAARESHESSNIEIDGYPVRIRFAEPFGGENSRPQNNKPQNNRIQNNRPQARERSFREREEPGPSNSLFLGSLRFETSEDSIEQMFEQFGRLNAVRIGRHPNGQSRGFAFVEYADESSAVAARAQHQHSPITIDGADLNIRFAEPRAKPERRQVPEEHGSSRCLFLGGLQFETTEADLEGMFGEFGTVGEVKIGRNTNGSSRCFGFIEFEDEASAIAARERHDAMPFAFADVPIRVRFAEPFGERS